MRRILLIAHRVPVSGAFTLNDLAGGAGRMDEIARSVSTAFTLSNDLRRDTEMTVLFVAEPPPKARRIELYGARLRHLNPDERSTAALLKNALVRSIPLAQDVEASPGIVVGSVDPARAIRSFVSDGPAVWLSEEGSPIRSSDRISSEFRAVVSDPIDPSEEERALLEEIGTPKVSVGPRSLRTSQVIDLLHNEADWREGPIGRPA